MRGSLFFLSDGVIYPNFRAVLTLGEGRSGEWHEGGAQRGFQQNWERSLS